MYWKLKRTFEILLETLLTTEVEEEALESNFKRYSLSSAVNLSVNTEFSGWEVLVAVVLRTKFEEES